MNTDKDLTKIKFISCYRFYYIKIENKKQQKTKFNSKIKINLKIKEIQQAKNFIFKS